ncbi:16S rRNA (guanine(966)-N(2))-methyltransferase RsmD [Trueperella sp. LYQ141]|uniref:16S rRNA (guanine(966)-N(2))-methyltransferase RsmD n=1 Tax=Trueperella sp. LYQ141 TaxID=3391058 RepID=UPI00398334AE
MTRIVAGAARGRTLQVPKSGTRPTSERVREALFSRLEHYGYVRDCRVLDLYSGSGALALEAVSRGASHAICVESDRQAAQIIRSNAEHSGLSQHVQVLMQPVEKYVNQTGRGDIDVVFLDPPYALGEAELAHVLAAVVEHLKPDAMIVVERDKHSPEPTWPAGVQLDDERIWGDTRVWSATRQD